MCLNRAGDRLEDEGAEQQSAKEQRRQRPWRAATAEARGVGLIAPAQRGLTVSFNSHGWIESIGVLWTGAKSPRMVLANSVSRFAVTR